jgi:hypothetical protein
MTVLKGLWTVRSRSLAGFSHSDKQTRVHFLQESRWLEAGTYCEPFLLSGATNEHLSERTKVRVVTYILGIASNSNEPTNAAFNFFAEASCDSIGVAVDVVNRFFGLPHRT